MKIRLARQWRQWTPGTVVEPSEGVANVLIDRGAAVPIDDSPSPEATANKNEEVETTMRAPAVENAMRAPKVKTRTPAKRGQAKRQKK